MYQEPLLKNKIFLYKTNYCFFPGFSSLVQQNHIAAIQEKLQLLEQKTKEAERSAELAEADAMEKDRELIETLKRMKDYEMVHNLFEKIVFYH